MKKQALRRFLITSLVAAFTLVAAYGQQAHALTVNIPFEFTAGDTTFPAGQYRITSATPAHSRATLLLRRTDGPQAAFCMTRAAETREAQKVSKLIFHHYGQVSGLRKPVGQEQGLIDLRKIISLAWPFFH